MTRNFTRLGRLNYRRSHFRRTMFSIDNRIRISDLARAINEPYDLVADFIKSPINSTNTKRFLIYEIMADYVADALPALKQRNNFN